MRNNSNSSEGLISLPAIPIKMGGKVGILLGFKLNDVLMRDEWMPSGHGKEAALSVLKCVEHLTSLYLKAEHLANCCKVILCLSRERAQMSSVSALFPSHSKENSLLPKWLPLCSHMWFPHLCLVLPKAFKWIYEISVGVLSSVTPIAVCALQQAHRTFKYFPLM